MAAKASSASRQVRTARRYRLMAYPRRGRARVARITAARRPWMEHTSRRRACRRRRSVAEQLDLELQGRVGRDHATGTARAIAQVRRDDQHAGAADLHPGHALVPALDDHAGTEREDEGLVAILRGIELRALLPVLVEPAGVVHGHVATRRRLGAVADDGVLVLQAGG